MDLPFPVPLLLALSPALVAVILALSTRRVVLSLLLGVVAGAIVAHLDQVIAGQLYDSLTTLVSSLVDAVVPGISSFDVNIDGQGAYLFGAVDGDVGALDTSHLVITAFSLLVAGMVGVLGRSGATRALVRMVEGLAKGPRGAQVSAWLAGGIVFFDDYANCLVVGSALGPLFDRFRVSRAKLAYIVDSTAAPVASLALVSTWVGYEVGLIGDELVKAGSTASAFPVFLSALPYRFYGFVTLAMVGAVAFSGRDFGPMLAAERAARSEPRPVSTEPSPTDSGAWVAIVSVGGLLVVVFSYLIIQGTLRVAEGEPFFSTLFTSPFFSIIGAADPFAAMFWGSLVALVLAWIGAGIGDALSWTELPQATWRGMMPVMEALGVLFLAWALGNAMAQTGAADALSELVAPTDTIVYDGAPVELAWHVLDSAERARVQVVDVEGVSVFSRELGAVDAGPGRMTWEGSGPTGGAVATGSYALVITAIDKQGQPVKTLVRGQERFPAWMLPSIIFLVAAGIAFATGTSFGTMGILIPLAVPLGVWLEAGDPGPVLLGSIAAVLAGAILGDHASPISDTTVLSALGAGVDLVEHVRTQLPYALTAGFISLIFGYIPAGLGVSPWILIPIGCGMAVLAVFVFGRRSDPPSLGPIDEAELMRTDVLAPTYERD